MELYFDAEFDAIHHGQRHVQCLISIGLVVVHHGVIVDCYYSLIHPKHFRKLTGVVRKITKLRDEQILHAPSFATIMREIEDFLHSYNEEGIWRIYSFGPDDARTIQKHAEFERVRPCSVFAHVVDLQRILSKKVVCNGEMLSATLSLDDLKYVYGIKGEVVHNALNDALDLMQVHTISQVREPLPLRVREIKERRQQKELEVKRRAHERMLCVLHERYDPFDGMFRQIKFYPDVINQLKCLSDHVTLTGLCFDDRGILWEDTYVFYDSCNMVMGWQMHDVPQMVFFLTLHHHTECVPVPLTYRNAGIFFDIWNLLLDEPR